MTYSCISCNRISKIANTHNRMGVPSYCVKCLEDQAKEKSQGLYDQYPEAKAKHIAEGQRIVSLYEQACKALGKVSIEKAFAPPHRGPGKSQAAGILAKKLNAEAKKKAVANK